MLRAERSTEKTSGSPVCLSLWCCSDEGMNSAGRTGRERKERRERRRRRRGGRRREGRKERNREGREGKERRVSKGRERPGCMWSGRYMEGTGECIL